jgi:hypothetical protein
MINWHSQHDLSVSPKAEPSVLPLVDSDKGHELCPPTNLWYLVAVLLLQWAPMEAWEDPAATLAALEKAIPYVLDSLQGSIVSQPARWHSWFFSQVMQMQHAEELVW